MQVFKTFSGKIILLITFVSCLIAWESLDNLNTNDDRCLNLADGFGYYMYLPHLFDEGSLYMTQEWAESVQDEYCRGCDVYQLAKRDNGNNIDIYHIGLSYVLLPSYVVGDVVARSSGYKSDGFSTPYHVMSILNRLFFIILGLIFFGKLLLLFVSDKIAALTILLIYLASNVYVTFVHQWDLPHLYLFTINSIFLYHFFKFCSFKKRRSLIYAAIFFGLTTSIRPTQVLIGIIPLIFLLKEYGNTKLFWKSILLFPLMSLLWNIPQILYWSIVGGELITANLHTEDIVLVDPNMIDFLFSYRKGWLLYSPMFLLLPLGLYKLYNINRTLFWASGSFIILYIYILSSWETWYYAHSFGSRVMVDIYPIIGLVIALYLNSISKKIGAGLLIIFSFACLALNFIQSAQMEKGYLHTERMSKEHYWYIFGRLDIPEYNESRLLIDRSHFWWIGLQKKFPSKHRKVYIREIYNLGHSLKAEPTKDLTIGRINILDLAKTDETMFEVHMTVKTSNNKLSSLLRMEAVSHFNVYGWKHFEVSQGTSETEFVELIFIFNLPDVRHTNDEMQIYLDNDANVSIEIKEFKIIAHSLIRK